MTDQYLAIRVFSSRSCVWAYSLLGSAAMHTDLLSCSWLEDDDRITSSFSWCSASAMADFSVSSSWGMSSTALSYSCSRRSVSLLRAIVAATVSVTPSASRLIRLLCAMISARLLPTPSRMQFASSISLSRRLVVRFSWVMNNFSVGRFNLFLHGLGKITWDAGSSDIKSRSNLGSPLSVGMNRLVSPSTPRFNWLSMTCPWLCRLL